MYKEKLKEIIKEKITKINHGVDLDKFYSKEKPEETTFLMNKGWRNLEDRGGIQYGIRAYLEEFTGKDKVTMIVKLNTAYGIPNIDLLMNQIKPKDKTDFAPIHFNIENLEYDKLVNIYNKANVFISLTRAEAFNIPCLEASACGLPVITTRFGGQSEFINNENGWIIGGKLEEVKHELLYEGIKWLTPDIQELRKAMREAYENKDLVKQKGERATETASQMIWEETAKKIINLK